MTELTTHRAYPSLRGVFDEVRLLCQDNDDPTAVAAAVDRLLCAEGSSGEENALDARTSGAAGEVMLSKHIAIFVRNVSMQHLSVRNVLLVHLLRLPDPLPFIEVVPSLFSVAVAPDMVQEVAQQLQQVSAFHAGLCYRMCSLLCDCGLSVGWVNFYSHSNSFLYPLCPLVSAAAAS